MRNRYKWLMGVASIAVTLSIIVLLTEKKKTFLRNEKLDRIADEGYETAGDILYPLN